MNTAIEHATDLTRRGFCTVPVPYREKKPRRNGWQNLRLAEKNLPRYFNGKPMNIGILMGEPSGWVVDIDLDHPLAVQLADSFLPHTDATFGRASKSCSHRLFRVTAPAKTKQFRTAATKEMIVELRSTGCQTIAPGSTHKETGEAIEWDSDGEPAEIGPAELLAAVTALADAVKQELGEPTRAQAPHRDAALTSAVQTTPGEAMERFKKYAAKCPDSISGQGGHNAILRLVCEAVRFGLQGSELKQAAKWVNATKCSPPWSPRELQHKIADAIAKVSAEGKVGVRLQKNQPAVVARIGTPQGEEDCIVVEPRHTPPIARAFIESRYTVNCAQELYYYAGEYLRHGGTFYTAAEDAAIRREVYNFLEHEAVDTEGKPLKVNQHLVNGVMDALAAHSHLSASVTAPAWLGDVQDVPPAREVIACKSRLLHLPTMRFMEPTPRFFTTSGLDFDPVADAPTPTRWLTFLDDLFGDDIEQRDMLQEIFGYLLTADTSQQKIVLIVGPKRSGKGTIARVLTALVGAANVAGPTTSSLAGPFGLQPLLGRSVAIISDARFSGEGVPVAIERMLAISGEDAMTVDRKHRESVTTKLPTRFLILSNELPRLADASATIPSRFLILTLKRSFYGKEDTHLTRDLLAELPGIFLWAVEGWRRLQARGQFIQPSAGVEAQRLIEDLASPVGAFVRERCEVGPGHRVGCGDLYAAWRTWCEGEGRVVVGTRHGFSRDLSAVVPGVATKRGTNNLRFYAGIRVTDPRRRLPPRRIALRYS